MHEFFMAKVDTGETTIFVRGHGSVPPLLLLHGFPQTHLMWRSVAPVLAASYSVVCVDLRGYGRSGCPASGPDHAAYAKRAMVRDMIARWKALASPNSPSAAKTAADESPTASRSTIPNA
jgi:haloacetate dehalogenase